MNDDKLNLQYEVVEFDEELYNKNISENIFEDEEGMGKGELSQGAISYAGEDEG